jgi:hypothetical protein
MTCFSVPASEVPDDGYYVAEWCPNCLAVRPFRLEEDREGQYLACHCGYVCECEEGSDSPGTSVEPEVDDDGPSEDAAVWHATRTDGADDLAEGVRGECPECGEDARFEEMSDEEFAENPPAPDPNGDGIWWRCVRCGCYPTGVVVSTPAVRLNR